MKRKLFRNINVGFKCENCGLTVAPLKWGGRNRNHCASCLFSLHVDLETPGDRLSSCCGLMKPIAIETRRTGEFALIHECLKCGKISKNRVAGDDDWDLICELSKSHEK